MTSRRIRRPYKIQWNETHVIRGILALIGITSNYKIYVTNTVRGRCSYKNQNITIPMFAIKDTREGFTLYYICHEIAHEMTYTAGFRKRQSSEGPHGATFQSAFRSICPKKYQHFELGYKPRLAVAAGIRKPKETK